jgi:hypothetical protein
LGREKSRKKLDVSFLPSLKNTEIQRLGSIIMNAVIIKETVPIKKTDYLSTNRVMIYDVKEDFVVYNNTLVKCLRCESFRLLFI